MWVCTAEHIRLHGILLEAALNPPATPDSRDAGGKQ